VSEFRIKKSEVEEVSCGVRVTDTKTLTTISLLPSETHKYDNCDHSAMRYRHPGSDVICSLMNANMAGVVGVDRTSLGSQHTSLSRRRLHDVLTFHRPRASSLQRCA